MMAELLAPAEVLLSSHNEILGAPWQRSKIHGPGNQPLWQGSILTRQACHQWAVQRLAQLENAEKVCL